MAVQGESQESTFLLCLINLVQDVSEHFFVGVFVCYPTGCVLFSASYQQPFIYHIPGWRKKNKQKTKTPVA